MAFELDRKTEEAGAYPIVLASYLIACQSYETRTRPTWSRAS